MNRISPTESEERNRADVVDFELHDKAGAWFDAFAKDCVVRIEKSREKAATAKKKELSGKPRTLKHDDDDTDGKKSMAGSGHILMFDAPAGEWYLTSVQVYGSRYGAAQAPKEDFTITLCDKDFKPIKSWKKPYSTFDRGEAEWKTIALPPTRVPARFCVCVSFNPTASKGVFLHFDGSSKGHSYSGLPGRKGEKLAAGEWMMRVEVDAKVKE